MTDTSGFYKLLGETMLYAPNFVAAPDYTLTRETHDNEVHDGWQWFDDAADAYAAAGLPMMLNSQAEIDDLTVAIVMGL